VQIGVDHIAKGGPTIGCGNFGRTEPDTSLRGKRRWIEGRIGPDDDPESIAPSKDRQ